MLQAIIFDCFGVLYVPVGEDFYQTHIPEYVKYEKELQDLGRQADYGLIDQKDVVARVAELAGMDQKAVRTQLVGGMARNQRILDLAKSLRPKYKIGMLSNISRDTMNHFFAPKEREALFDAVVISSEVGTVKPYPEIYHLTCERLGVEPSGALMIDDSEANCEGAKEAGLQAIHYTTYTNFEQELQTCLSYQK